MQDIVGVCAKVRIKIEQRVTLTREAFLARLEIENGESETLENIRVEIHIALSSTPLSAEHLFSIGTLVYMYMHLQFIQYIRARTMYFNP